PCSVQLPRVPTHPAAPCVPLRHSQASKHRQSSLVYLPLIRVCNCHCQDEEFLGKLTELREVANVTSKECRFRACRMAQILHFATRKKLPECIEKTLKGHFP